MYEIKKTNIVHAEQCAWYSRKIGFRSTVAKNYS